MSSNLSQKSQWRSNMYVNKYALHETLSSARGCVILLWDSGMHQRTEKLA